MNQEWSNLHSSTLLTLMSCFGRNKTWRECNYFDQQHLCRQSVTYHCANQSLRFSLAALSCPSTTAPERTSLFLRVCVGVVTLASGGEGTAAVTSRPDHERRVCAASRHEAGVIRRPAGVGHVGAVRAVLLELGVFSLKHTEPLSFSRLYTKGLFTLKVTQGHFVHSQLCFREQVILAVCAHFAKRNLTGSQKRETQS